MPLMPGLAEHSRARSASLKKWSVAKAAKLPSARGEATLLPATQTQTQLRYRIWAHVSISSLATIKCALECPQVGSKSEHSDLSFRVQISTLEA